MATKFSTIFERAVFKFKDYSFIDAVREIKDYVLTNYLLASVADFSHECIRYDLNDYNLDTAEFSADLDNEVIEILATGIAFHWLDMEALNQKLMKNRILRTDYTTYSPGNLLKEIAQLRDTYRAEYIGRINNYSFRYGGIEKLKT